MNSWGLYYKKDNDEIKAYEAFKQALSYTDSPES